MKKGHEEKRKTEMGNNPTKMSQLAYTIDANQIQRLALYKGKA